MSSALRRLRLPILLALVLAVSGCTGSLARMMVEPSAAGGLFGRGLAAADGQLAEFRDRMTWVLNAEAVPVHASDGMELFTVVLEPGDYGLDWEGRWERDGFRFSFRFDTDSLERDGTARPRGTVVLLHGLYTESLQLLPQALFLTEHGYRVVLTDLRAHGRSGGRYVTYGVRERKDLAALVNTLRAEDRLARPLILYGTSLGATVALQGAATGVAADRVVAVAAMADPREVVTGSGPEMLPGYLRWIVSEDRVEVAAERAERLADFTWKNASTETLAPDVAVPVLLVHARRDDLVPFEHAERLHGALPCSTLRPVDRHGHASMLMDPSPTAALVLSWLAGERSCRPAGDAPDRVGRDSPGRRSAPRPRLLIPGPPPEGASRSPRRPGGTSPCGSPRRPPHAARPR